MKKHEFLAELRRRLAGLSASDIEQSLDFYAEQINDRMEDGMTEEEAVAAMGPIDEIAAKILMEFPLVKVVRAKVKPKRRLRTWEIVLLILGAPLWISLAAGAFVILLSIYIAFGAIAISLFSLIPGIALYSVAGFVNAVYLFDYGQIGGGIALIGGGLLCAGITVLLLVACIPTVKGIIKLHKLAGRGIKRLFIGKGETQ